MSCVHPTASFLTSVTIRLGVSVGPDGKDRRSCCPLARILTEVPPTSTTSTFLSEDFFAAPDRSGRAVLRLSASDFDFTRSALPLEGVGLGADHVHQLGP